ncbi:YdcF family protein [Alkalitalea saponilacus]|uniref:Uncharacterized SAM-binding protein YcdF, DUF218 family n=1 Tax=Alkalitalea saponilacus TaxID=889453 RepID=A0A1T5CJU6_9BACT|nr:YdcF family protein [Alkalitalea saponilacus]SKB59694.1 Uncharacterized SAM-binding protein YcdF, DUF218 family [Alkalitalea saponilacus]
MFFVLSKVLGFLLSPLNLVLLCLLASFFFRKQRKKLWYIALFVGLFFSNPLIFRTVVVLWEDSPEPLPVNDANIRQIVVLGGMSSWYEESERIRFWQSGDRLMQTLLLVHQNPVERIVISGGSAAVMYKERGEGAFLSEFIKNLSLDGVEIVVDSLSRNTYENSFYTAQIFNDSGWDNEIVLVTSAWHMKRAKAVFEKQGFDVLPIGADPLYPNSPITPATFIVPSAGVFGSWELILKEWVGIAVYRLRGYL